MKYDIRNNIKYSFKDSNINEINNSLKTAIKGQEEIDLPGLGVFFELLWENSNEGLKNEIIFTIKQAI